jgi:glycosyltransferase involved in cell wall biosynthesis
MGWHDVGGRSGGADRLAVDGKQFALSGARFPLRGVTYGTFRPRELDGERFPATSTIASDVRAMSGAGFNTVRTYTAPPEDLLTAADDAGLKVVAGLFHPDFRYLVGASRRAQARMAREWRAEVAEAAKRFAGDGRLGALCLGNEVPADVVRWVGARRVSSTISALVSTVKEIDPQLLVTYANYPTAEYLPLEDLDFLTFNVYLERRLDLRRYLNRLHNLAGERPVVLGEVGLDSGGTADGEQAQAESISWQLETALERGAAGTCLFSWTDEWFVGDAEVDGWYFGLTDADRRPKPALAAARRWNGRTVRDLDVAWPTVSIVICAYNAAATLDECLSHTAELVYPGLEVIVVDDGSTDDTAAIAQRHAHVRLIQIPHAGLSAARNAGLEVANGELIAYLDSDAFPTPEWPYYLALGLDARDVGGVGGPNVPPTSDGIGAEAVARAPGGPVHVLVGDDRAEHIPGCNMAFWREVLQEAGGFDPVYTAAGDDVDLCWKVLDNGWQIGFHPAAVVWHHRRTGVRAYARQQRGYGRAEALVATRHPHRFTSTGTARWRGRIYAPGTNTSGRQRIYRGQFATAAYQSVYQAPSHGIDVAHQLGVPAAVLAATTALLGPWWPPAGLIAGAGALALLMLAVIDVARVSPPRALRGSAGLFRCRVAALHLVQPIARSWGRATCSIGARRDQLPAVELPGPSVDAPGGVLVLPADRPREQIVEQVIGCLTAHGLRTMPATAWSSYDATVFGSALVCGRLVTSSWPEGAVQIRFRPRPRLLAIGLLAGLASALGAAGSIGPVIAFSVAAAIELGRGAWAVGPRARRVIRRSCEAAHDRAAHPSTREAAEVRVRPITRFSFDIDLSEHTIVLDDPEPEPVRA